MPFARMTIRRWMIAVAVAAVIASGTDWSVIGMALLILIRVGQHPQPVHRTTAILLTLLAGILLWANLRPTGWQEVCGWASPPELDPITKALFWRGWPLCPCMVCEVHSLSFHHSGLEECVLVFDGVLFVVALLATKAVCEWCLRRLPYRNIEGVQKIVSPGPEKGDIAQ